VALVTCADKETVPPASVNEAGDAMKELIDGGEGLGCPTAGAARGEVRGCLAGCGVLAAAPATEPIEVKGAASSPTVKIRPHPSRMPICLRRPRSFPRKIATTAPALRSPLPRSNRQQLVTVRACLPSSGLEARPEPGDALRPRL
jgi:hypothetical protein